MSQLACYLPRYEKLLKNKRRMSECKLCAEFSVAGYVTVFVLFAFSWGSGNWFLFYCNFPCPRDINMMSRGESRF